jgi:hypothetical protein
LGELEGLTVARPEAGSLRDDAVELSEQRDEDGLDGIGWKD